MKRYAFKLGYFTLNLFPRNKRKGKVWWGLWQLVNQITY